MVDTSKPNPALGGSIKYKIVNPDLKEERDKCTFDQREVEEFFFTKEGADSLNSVMRDFDSHPDTKISFGFSEKSREE